MKRISFSERMDRLSNGRYSSSEMAKHYLSAYLNSPLLSGISFDSRWHKVKDALARVFRKDPEAVTCGEVLLKLAGPRDKIPKEIANVLLAAILLPFDMYHNYKAFLVWRIRPNAISLTPPIIDKSFSCTLETVSAFKVVDLNYPDFVEALLVNIKEHDNPTNVLIRKGQAILNVQQKAIIGGRTLYSDYRDITNKVPNLIDELLGPEIVFYNLEEEEEQSNMKLSYNANKACKELMDTIVLPLAAYIETRKPEKKEVVTVDHETYPEMNKERRLSNDK